jgi:diguanylate cyclase (GGDEF)-like protein/PAS domain S-box-containing protein
MSAIALAEPVAFTVPVHADLNEGRRFRTTFELLPIGAAHASIDGRFLYVNPALCAMLGYAREECMALFLQALAHPADATTLHMAVTLLAKQSTDFRQTRELRLRRKDNSVFRASVTLLHIQDAHAPYLLIVVETIGAHEPTTEQRLAHRAYHDSLTGLPNRALFHEHLKRILLPSRRQGGIVAVLFIDLDHFKVVNDTMGHAAGDRLLQQVAARIDACTREADTVGRLGGDEFGVILTGLASARDAGSIADKIMTSLAEPFQIDGRDAFVTASIGITLCPSDSEEPDTLLRNADTAMYRAIELGRNNYKFFTAEMNHLMVKRATLENGLHKALERKELFLHFQPQADMRSGRIVGVEALMRWHHPEMGIISPGDFIPVAEESGLIVAMGEWAIRAACAQNKAWQDAGLPPVAIAVNMSARQFRQHDVVAVVQCALLESGLDGRYLELELTESIVMDNAEALIATMRELKSLGVRLSIDDFGTGYSNLAYLKRFPLDALKIDKSFVRGIGDSDDGAIASTVIALGHSLGLQVVAEGVEDTQELEFLRDLGCDLVQGYLTGKPMPPQHLAALLAGQAARA